MESVGLCSIRCLCTSISAPFIRVDEFIYLTSVGVEIGGGAAMSIWPAILLLYFTFDIWEFYFR